MKGASRRVSRATNRETQIVEKLREEANGTLPAAEEIEAEPGTGGTR